MFSVDNFALYNILLIGLMQEIFEGLKKLTEVGNASLNDKDLEYLEAACLLHTVGLFTGKKGYHKRSYQIIMVSSHNPNRKRVGCLTF